jgi:hypothetical protein
MESDEEDIAGGGRSTGGDLAATATPTKAMEFD